MTNETLRQVVTNALDNAKFQVTELTEALDAIEADAVITVTDGIITKE